MPNPDPRPTPPARQPAASQGRSRGRRPRPGPPGFTYEVQLLGGEAGRLLAQEQTEAIAAVLAWLATHPPMPTATTGPAATAVGKPGGQSTATRTGTRPAQPSSAGPADGSTQRGTGGSGGWADTHAEPAEALRRAGRPGGWRVVVDGSDRGAGAGGGEGGVGRHPRRTGRGPPAGRAAWRVAGRGRRIRPRCGCRRWGWWGRAGRLGRSHGRWVCTQRRNAAGSGKRGMGGGPPWACRSPTALTLPADRNKGQKGSA